MSKGFCHGFVELKQTCELSIWELADLSEIYISCFMLYIFVAHYSVIYFDFWKLLSIYLLLQLWGNLECTLRNFRNYHIFYLKIMTVFAVSTVCHGDAIQLCKCDIWRHSSYKLRNVDKLCKAQHFKHLLWQICSFLEPAVVCSWNRFSICLWPQMLF